MEILHFEDLGDTSVVSECSFGANLVIDNFFYVASGTSPLYMEILDFEDLGDTSVVWLRTQLF